jgi:metal-responsive CopG/Arc/MetJ family transcriptional regulator
LTLIKFERISKFSGESVKSMETVKKISVTLPEDLLKSLDEIVGKSQKRSKVIETALRDYVTKESRKELNRRDIEIINANADLINKQVEETLEFQAEW